MATGPNYRVAFRRRREGKTDYKQRRSLIISGLPRLVIRGSLKNILIQIIKAEMGGDKVIVSSSSKELTKKYGWQGGGGSLSVAYLTGLLCGYKANKNDVKEVVLDLGLQAPSKGARIFAALEGVLTAGIIVPHDENKIPSEQRIQGVHVTEYAKNLSSNQDIYQKQFSKQLSRGVRPEELAEHFSEVKATISSSFQKVEVLKVKSEKRGEKKTPKTISKKKKTSRRKAVVKKIAGSRVKKREETEKLEKKK
jgi:large subunit ribosomal protein L18